MCTLAQSEGSSKPDHWWATADACKRANSVRFATDAEWSAVRPAKQWDYSGYTFNGEKVMKQTSYRTVEQLHNSGY